MSFSGDCDAENSLCAGLVNAGERSSSVYSLHLGTEEMLGLAVLIHIPAEKRLGIEQITMEYYAER